jgi:hypothetical protein
LIDQTSYIITIVTNSKEDAGTDSGVHMTIFGDKDTTKQFQLTNGTASFESGKTNVFEMKLDDVGNVCQITNYSTIFLKFIF